MNASSPPVTRRTAVKLAAVSLDGAGVGAGGGIVAKGHPRDSLCGLDVEKMDTTFLAKSSRHDIHAVACRDCHPQGRPQGRKP